jgi:glycosyltransferase involved in cell wall biosynthesis
MPHPRILFVSTYPPTQCGIATFTRSLLQAMAQVRGSDQGLGVARVRGGTDDSTSLDPELVVEVSNQSPLWPAQVARATVDFDLVWVQHEFGIFGPGRGARLLDLCEALEKPVVSTLHTVLLEPTRMEREIIEGLSSRSQFVVVMSQAARERLLSTHEVDPGKVSVIQHGAHVYRRIGCHDRDRHLTVATWGLLGPGKGIEWGIRALTHLTHLRPLRYHIQGATHPNVLATEGEAYRHYLQALASDLGVSDMLTMSAAYLPSDRLAEMMEAIDVVLLPYDSRLQVTSGVLVEALAAGLPVVATAFPHAIELLSEGAGRVVPHRNPKAMATALETLLTRPRAMRAAAMAARRIAPDLRWSSVARRYELAANQAISAASHAGVA